MSKTLCIATKSNVRIFSRVFLNQKRAVNTSDHLLATIARLLGKVIATSMLDKWDNWLKDSSFHYFKKRSEFVGCRAAQC